MIVFLLSAISVQNVANAVTNSQQLSVTVKNIELLELENSNVLVVNMNILNNGNEEASFFANNFDLLDSNLKQYGTISSYELREKGKSITRGICDTIFGDSVNPGLSINLEICFEVPKSNFQYDSILIYNNMFVQNANSAKLVPLVKNSVGQDALINKSNQQNEQIAVGQDDDALINKSNQQNEQIAVGQDDDALINKSNQQNEKIADRVDEIESQGGCLIATAAYGTELAPDVQNLREIRNKMYETKMGGDIMHTVNDFYYSFSPTVADWERENSLFKEIMKLAITPSMTSFTIINHENIGSEDELVAYVASIVALNMGMYFVAPAIIILGIRKKISL